MRIGFGLINVNKFIICKLTNINTIYIDTSTTHKHRLPPISHRLLFLKMHVKNFLNITISICFFK